MSEQTPEFIEKMRDTIMIDFATLRSLIVKDLAQLDANAPSGFLRRFNRESVKIWLDDPKKNEKNIRDLSIALYNASSHYRRLVLYFARILTLDYVLAPSGGSLLDKSNKKSLMSAYKKALDLTELMNIKHEFSKILTIAVREDVFYGYHHVAKESSYIQKFNPNYCRISSVEDGCFNFEFDFGYFDNRKDALGNLIIDQYPPEFKKKFNIYKKDSKMRWQEIDSENTICIKVNEDLEYPVPPFFGIFEDIFDLKDYKTLRKVKEKIGNYKILVQEIPMRENSQDNNDFAITLDVAKIFHEKVSQSTPDEVGVVTSPMKISDINFAKDRANDTNVAQAENSVFSSAGVPQVLFNSDSAGSIGLTNSIIVDEALMFAVLRQIERWVNRKMKFNGGKFKVIMPDLTIFNRTEMFESYKSSAEFGIPTKMFIGASLGMSPSDFINLNIMETEVLQLQDKLIPLASSHTQSGDEAIKPKKKDSELSDEGVATRDGQKNNRG